MTRMSAPIWKRSSYLNFFSKFLIVLALTAALDAFIGKTLEHFYFNTTTGIEAKLIYGIEESESDLLILGDSRAEHHYVAAMFEDSLELSSFNMGRAGHQSIIFHYAVFHEIMQRHRPQLVLLNLGPGELLTTFNRSEYDRLSELLPFARRHGTIHEVVLLRNRYEEVKLISRIYPFNSKILNVLYDNPNRQKHERGFIPRTGGLQSDTLLPAFDATRDRDLLDTTKIRYLLRFFEEARTNQVALVVVISPQYLLYEGNISMEYLDTACRSRGIPLWNYASDSLFLHRPDLFSDPGHLNNEGARVFSRLLIDRIRASSLLTGTPHDQLPPSQLSPESTEIARHDTKGRSLSDAPLNH